MMFALPFIFAALLFAPAIERRAPSSGVMIGSGTIRAAGVDQAWNVGETEQAQP
jgi:hypothetical protein